jgi:hypothetical protein
MSRSWGVLFLVGVLAGALLADEPPDPPAPTVDRVGFPKDYQDKFEVLRSVNRSEKQQLITVFGNTMAATIKRMDQLPYPYGSILVMETASAQKDSEGKPLLDEKGTYKKDQVLGLHVMRREKDFGEAYGKNRTGEWEYAEYRADGSYITPPQKSFACAECHVKAGRERDFVYRGRLPAEGGK